VWTTQRIEENDGLDLGTDKKKTVIANLFIAVASHVIIIFFPALMLKHTAVANRRLQGWL